MNKKTWRDVNGVLLLDKPLQMTSNQALQIVKRLFQAKKAGHTGSLDPLATGMLPLCFGEATKFSQFLLEADKVYEVTAKLGVKTTTGDAEGEVMVEKNASHITEAQLFAVLQQFLGEIQQVPSMYSAIKHQGQPLYKLARQGIEIERPSRTVNIRELTLLSMQNPHFTLRVHCSKGTYIRTLIEDIGEVLQCGAFVTHLRRISVSGYEEAQMVTLEKLQNLSEQNPAQLDSYLLPTDSAIATWPELKLSEAAAFYLKQGQAVILPQAPSQGCVRFTLPNGRFLGVGEILSDGRVAPKRLVQHL